MIKKVRKGFTLIELVVVIAVIAILSAVSVVAYVGITNNAKKSSASQKAAQIVTTIRAGALASDQGYSSKWNHDDNAQTAEQPYVVKLDGKLLSVYVYVDDSEEKLADNDANILKILNHMVGELEESDLKADDYKVVEGKSQIGIKPSDKLPMQYASF